jgi:hypothetical protein
MTWLSKTYKAPHAMIRMARAPVPNGPGHTFEGVLLRLRAGALPAGARGWGAGGLLTALAGPVNDRSLPLHTACRYY